MPGLPCDYTCDDPPVSLSVPASGLHQYMLLPRQTLTHACNDGAHDVERGRGNDMGATHGHQRYVADDVYGASAAEPHEYGSAESEHDLAAMVHDFMENGSCGSEFHESSDGENCAMNGPKLFEIIQALKLNSTPLEKELLSVVTVLALSVKESDLSCMQSESECKGGCIRGLLVRYLQCSGFDAAVCTSKWPNSGRVPGGEYEYIDAILKDDSGATGRLIVDIDFRSQFEIARPTHSYATALQFLPGIFVGSEEKLGQILQVMAEAGKLSLRQNSMPLPPWRTLDYMTAKWMSPSERIVVDLQTRVQWGKRLQTKQCVEQLRHLKVGINAESDRTHIGMLPSVLDRNMALKSWREIYSEKNSSVMSTAEKKPG